jgi:Flp pilus assembly pilin Flp
MLRQRKNKKTGQVLIEYTMIIGVIVAILMAMSTMIKRGLQGMIKVTADQIGNQENADQRFDESGHMVRSYSSTRASGDTLTTELMGEKSYQYSDTVRTESMTVSNLGFAEEE